MAEEPIKRPPDPFGAAPGPAQPQRRWRLAPIAFLLAAAALGFTAWQWYETQKIFEALQQDVAKRLTEADALSRETRSLAGQSRDELRDVVARLGQLDARMAETQNQRLALESLYRELSSSRDEWTLAEVEQVLLIANQQLQLAGNLKAALIALETADSRLARMDRPQLIQLRRVINQDIERLKAMPHVDVIGMALRLDNVIARIDALPLAMERRPVASAAGPAPESGGFWSTLWRETVRDLHSLVRIQNAQEPEVPLLSPEQTFFLRENLKIRLLAARLSLVAHDEASFRADIKAASDWLARYYDTGDRSVAAAQSTIRQLAQSTVSIELPDISASLDAARNFKLVRERSIR